MFDQVKEVAPGVKAPVRNEWIDAGFETLAKTVVILTAEFHKAQLDAIQHMWMSHNNPINDVVAHFREESLAKIAQQMFADATPEDAAAPTKPRNWKDM